VTKPMMRPLLLGCLLVGDLALCGCAYVRRGSRTETAPLVAVEFSWPAPAVDQKAEINALIDRLVFNEGEATNRPVLSPGAADQSQEYRERFRSCQDAFRKLSEFKGAAFPILIQHLDDKRQSINFRNHILANSVGYACFLIIHDQLQDEPDNYSEYGWSRKGRDGQDHPKPYWVGTPFDEAGGVARWLSANRNLTYTRMQIRCFVNREARSSVCPT